MPRLGIDVHVQAVFPGLPFPHHRVLSPSRLCLQQGQSLLAGAEGKSQALTETQPGLSTSWVLEEGEELSAVFNSANSPQHWTVLILLPPVFLVFSPLRTKLLLKTQDSLPTSHHPPEPIQLSLAEEELMAK